MGYVLVPGTKNSYGYFEEIQRCRDARVRESLYTIKSVRLGNPEVTADAAYPIGLANVRASPTALQSGIFRKLCVGLAATRSSWDGFAFAYPSRKPLKYPTTVQGSQKS